MKRRLSLPDTEPSYDGALPLELLCEISARFLDPFTQRCLAGTCHYLVGQFALTPLVFYLEPGITPPTEQKMLMLRSLKRLACAPGWIQKEATLGVLRHSAEARDDYVYFFARYSTNRPRIIDPSWAAEYKVKRAIEMGLLRNGGLARELRMSADVCIPAPTFTVQKDDDEFFKRALYELAYSKTAKDDFELVLRRYLWPLYEGTATDVNTFQLFFKYIVFPWCIKSDLYFPRMTRFVESENVSLQPLIVFSDGEWRRLKLLKRPEKTPLWFQWIFPRLSPRRQQRTRTKFSPVARTGLTAEFCAFLLANGFTLTEPAEETEPHPV